MNLVKMTLLTVSILSLTASGCGEAPADDNPENAAGQSYAMAVAADCLSGNESCDEGGSGYCDACSSANGTVTEIDFFGRPSNDCTCNGVSFNPYFSNCVNGTVTFVGDVGRVCN
jgi:hypothetical protein